MYCTIYELKFPDNSRYIGRTTDFKRRLQQHKSKPSNPLMKEKFDEYGLGSFSVKIIEGDINEYVGTLVECYEISIIPPDKRLNINSILKSEGIIDFYKENIDKYDDLYRDNSVNILNKALALKKSLNRFMPRYKKDEIDTSQLIKELTKVINLLTVELRRIK